MSEVVVRVKLLNNRIHKVSATWDNQLIDKYELRDRLSTVDYIQVFKFCVVFSESVAILSKTEEELILGDTCRISVGQIITSVYSNSFINGVRVKKEICERFASYDKMIIDLYSMYTYVLSKLYTYIDRVVKQEFAIGTKYVLNDSVNLVKLYPTDDDPCKNVDEGYFTDIVELLNSGNIVALELYLSGSVRMLEKLLNILHNYDISFVYITTYIDDDDGSLADIISRFLQKEGLLVFSVSVCIVNDINKIIESLEDNYTLKYVNISGTKDILNIGKRNRRLMKESRFKRVKLGSSRTLDGL
jgi:hypothetical protein